MIRRYTHSDKQTLIALLTLNTPRFFAEPEKGDFVDYLENHADNYFVVEKDGMIVASGGINYFTEPKSARIAWDMVHPECQGIGIGRELTLFRIHEIRCNSDVDLIVVRTTQLVYRFYEKMGFELEKTEKDYWAEGFDLCLMKMTIDRSI